ncbi:uncharacterized protein LOC123870978 [Maniola jurtina]|uniref:uncharacterized protein LOC123870978 n=1 Tax=Maniola jurtina TaxID=191418 RepID=UPI001E68F819|nr:uncharacterized protein LOC123870978 [Maniola jurtina]
MDELLLTRLKLLATQIETLSNQALSLGSLNNDLIYNAEVIKTKLQNLSTRLNDDLNNYFRMVNVPEVDEISEISEIQLKAEESLAELIVKLKIFQNKTEISSTNRTADTITSCRLPKLNLPEFEGDILSWHQFWDQFQSNIDKRNITEVDKLLYLKSSLKGEARKAIEGLDTTNKNYSIAIKTLKERYGKDSHLVDAHYSALSKVATTDSTITSCRGALNEIEKHLRVLESLGENVNHNHLRHLIFSKFPEDLIYELKLKTKDDSISEIRKELEKIITAREDANRITNGSNTKEAENYTVETLHVTQENRGRSHYRKDRIPPRREIRKNNWQTPVARIEPRSFRKRRFSQWEERKERREDTTSKGSNTTEGEVVSKRMKVSCVFCKGDHYSDLCDKYKTAKERKSRLGDRCYGCLMRNHRIAQCYSSRKSCYYCKKRGLHHRALCPQKFPSKTETTTLTEVDRR